MRVDVIPRQTLQVVSGLERDLAAVLGDVLVEGETGVGDLLLLPAPLLVVVSVSLAPMVMRTLVRLL